MTSRQAPTVARVDRRWINRVAEVLDIPFCVAGGIRSVADAEQVLNYGADKVSINSPALARPELIGELAKRFGTQCVVVGIDSRAEGDGYRVYQYTGDPDKTKHSGRLTMDWAREAQERGAGEIVLNCMNQGRSSSGLRSAAARPAARADYDSVNCLGRGRRNGTFRVGIYRSQGGRCTRRQRFSHGGD